MANACMLQNYRVATLAQIFLCRIFWGCWRKILRQCDSLDSPVDPLQAFPPKEGVPKFMIQIHGHGSKFIYKKEFSTFHMTPVLIFSAKSVSKQCFPLISVVKTARPQFHNVVMYGLKSMLISTIVNTGTWQPSIQQWHLYTKSYTALLYAGSLSS